MGPARAWRHMRSTLAALECSNQVPVKFQSSSNRVPSISLWPARGHSPAGWGGGWGGGGLPRPGRPAAGSPPRPWGGGSGVCSMATMEILIQIQIQLIKKVPPDVPVEFSCKTKPNANANASGSGTAVHRASKLCAIWLSPTFILAHVSEIYNTEKEGREVASLPADL